MQLFDKNFGRRFLVVFGFVFIDVLGYSLVLPLLPYIAEQFAATPAVVGLLLTSNALAQMVAAPVIGRLYDRYGRRPLLLVSIAGTVVSFLIFAFANSLAVLFFSRILDGLLGGNTSLARAYITDITGDKERSKGLGLIGAAFGLGFIVGPFTGGLLSQYGYALPGLVAAGVSLVNFIAVFIWLPESLTPEQKKKQRESPYTAFNLRRLVEALQTPCVGELLMIGFWYSMSFTLFQVNFVLAAKEKLALDVRTTSLLLSLVGLLAVVTQGGLVGWLTDRFSERKLIFAATLTLAASLVGWAFAPSVFALAVVLVPTAISAGITNVISTSLLTKAIHQEEVGGMLGISQSQQTFARVVAPLAGGPLIQYVAASAVGLVGAGLMGVAAYLEKKALLSRPPLKGPCGWEEEEGSIAG